MRLSSIGQNPCGPLAGVRDRDRRPCEGNSQASATRPVASARTASRPSRDADARPRRSVRSISHCATPERGSAASPNGCAMISVSIGHREGLRFFLRVAGRSTSMKGIKRSNLSCRTLLICFVLMGTPMAARSDTLEDSAKELARKIAAVLPPREGVAVDIQNVSTLTPEEVGRVSRTFTGSLQDSGFSVTFNGTGAKHVHVTLSENVKGFLWSAEISPGDASRIVFLVVPRSLENRMASNAMPITLRSEKFWEGQEQILDAVEVTIANDVGALFLLEPDGLVIRKTGADSSFKIEIPTARFATRIPFGSIQGENMCRVLEFSPCVTAMLDGQICTIALETRTVGECHYPGPLGARDTPGPIVFFRPSYPPGRSVPFTAMFSQCGAEIEFGTGAGDYTQPDSVQAFEWRGVTYVPLSNELSFPGPVMALQVGDRVPTAIVRNLETGNYEAYRLVITCSK